MADRSTQLHLFIKELESAFPEIREIFRLSPERLANLIHKTEPAGKLSLCWPGKAGLTSIISSPPNSQWVFRPELSINPIDTKNILVEGENLEVLKLLRKDYSASVKTIYIDPPYNTGKKHFIFKDHFANQTMRELSDKEIPTIRNTNPADQHSLWLSMMYPRLTVAKELLRDDGIIFISIDENELANLKLIMDEIFGEKNFVEIFSWAKSETPANLSKKSKKVVEYVVCYQKKSSTIKFTGVQKKVISSNGLLNQTNKVNTLTFPAGVVRTKIGDHQLPRGEYGTDKYQVTLLEDTEVRDGFFIKPVVLKAKFKWTQPKLAKEIAVGTLINIPTLKLSPSYERREYDAEVPPNLINHKVGVVTNEMAGQELAKLLGGKVFDFPKPTSLIKYLLGFSDDPNGVVLDFFAGSGSTAQAVLEMNQADNGNRKFICVQIPEVTPEKSLAREAGFQTISEITKTRIEKVIVQMQSTQETTSTKLGFKFYQLA